MLQAIDSIVRILQVFTFYLKAVSAGTFPVPSCEYILESLWSEN